MEENVGNLIKEERYFSYFSPFFKTNSEKNDTSFESPFIEILVSGFE